VNEAIDLYREVLTNDHCLYMAHVRLAEIYETAQMLPQAINSRRNAVNANPDDESLLLDLGRRWRLPANHRKPSRHCARRRVSTREIRVRLSISASCSSRWARRTTRSRLYAVHCSCSEPL